MLDLRARSTDILARKWISRQNKQNMRQKVGFRAKIAIPSASQLVGMVLRPGGHCNSSFAKRADFWPCACRI